jgi:multicomponent Na+:H+ antiporter subunit D
LAVFLPLFAAFLLPAVSFAERKYRIPMAKEWVSTVFVLAELLVVFSMFPVAKSSVITYELGGWPPPLGIVLAIDAFGALAALIIASIGALVFLYSFTYMRGESGLEHYYTLLFLLLAGCMGVVLTGDIFNFYVFFEIMSIASYALVAFRRNLWGIEAAIKYLIVGSLGTSFLLIGIAILYGRFGTLTLANIMQLLPQVPPKDLVIPLACFLVGIGIKIAMVPFHFWLPDAYQGAPTSVAAFFSGATATVGAYAVVRITYVLFGAWGVGSVFILFGLLTMVLGALMALVQRDLKRLLAYSGISQMGYVLVGLGLGTALGVQGALFHVFNNAAYKTLLFMVAGAVIWRAGTSRMDELGGLWNNMPITASLFLLGSLAIAGVPPLNGFASKWMIYLAGVEYGGVGYAITGTALIISALTLAYFLKALSAVFLGQRPARLSGVREPPMFMILPMMVLAVVCVVFGLLPQLGIQLVAPAQSAIFDLNGYIRGVMGG